MCRKALYNIGKKTVTRFSADLRKTAPVLACPNLPHFTAVRTAHKLASQHLSQLQALLPKAAKLHENVLYEACLNAQSACMAVQSALGEIADEVGV